MKIPAKLLPLYEDGLIDEVLYQLMSGKEATVYVVRSGEEIRCAKVYKEAAQRSFKQAAKYQEGRREKNSRRARAMEKGSKFGRKQMEESWQNAEVDALYRVARAGVRVPRPYGCFDGVLLMELVTDSEGEVAPRLGEVDMSAQQAREDHALMMHYIQLMLCAGLVHGDLSEFNVLLGEEGPVIIDLPQAIDAAGNNHAQRVLLRDVANLRTFIGGFAPELLKTNFGPEIWAKYKRGLIPPETPRTGRFESAQGSVDVSNVLREIDDARAEDAARRLRMLSS